MDAKEIYGGLRSSSVVCDDYAATGDFTLRLVHEIWNEFDQYHFYGKFKFTLYVPADTILHTGTFLGEEDIPIGDGTGSPVRIYGADVKPMPPGLKRLLLQNGFRPNDDDYDFVVLVGSDGMRELAVLGSF